MGALILQICNDHVALVHPCALATVRAA